MKRSANLFAGLMLLATTTSLAAGDPHSQGTMLAGQGLDWQRSGERLQPSGEVTSLAPAFAPAPTPSQQVPYPQQLALTAAKMPVNPSDGSNSFKINRASLDFKNCVPISDLVTRCEVQAIQNPAAPEPQKDTQLCGHWLGKKESIWVYVIQGTPDSQGMFTFPGSPGTFVACSVSDAAKPDNWEWGALGAVGKCLLWPREIKDAAGNITKKTGWIPEMKNPDSKLAFNACLRAVRADYCGTGVTHTVDNTHIELYGVKERRDVDLPYLLEATWDEQGAICIIHARWKRLSPTCQRKFGHVLGQPTPLPESEDIKGSKDGKGSTDARSGSVAPSRAVGPAVVIRTPRGIKAPTDGGTDADLWTGTEYHCDPVRTKAPHGVSCDSNQSFMGQALRLGILADDSMLNDLL